MLPNPSITYLIQNLIAIKAKYVMENIHSLSKLCHFVPNLWRQFLAELWSILAHVELWRPR